MFRRGTSRKECVYRNTLVSINNSNDNSFAYFSPVFFDCLEHLDDLSYDASYFNEINYFDSIDLSSVAKFNSAEQKMMNSSNSYFQQATWIVFPSTDAPSTTVSLGNLFALPKH